MENISATHPKSTLADQKMSHSRGDLEDARHYLSASLVVAHLVLLRTLGIWFYAHILFIDKRLQGTGKMSKLLKARENQNLNHAA
jgi:hypothetical protein